MAVVDAENHGIRPLTKHDLRPLFISVLVSIICITIFGLPSDMRNALKTKNAVFNPLTYVTASFVHDSLGHLTLNLIAFIPSIFLLYFLNKKANSQKFFLVSLPIIFIVMPILSYGLVNFYGIYRQVEYSFGLSLVNGVLIGLFVPSLIIYLQCKLEKFNPLLFFLSMLFLTLGLVSFLYSLYLASVVSLIFSFVFGWFNAKRIGSFLSLLLKDSKNFIETFVFLFAFFFYFFSIFGLFPFTVGVSQDSMVGVVQHWIGLLFGIILFSFYSIPKAIIIQKQKSSQKQRA